MDPTRKTARVTGVLFIITFITSIPAALWLYTPVLDDANYILGAGADTRVAWGAFLEVLLIIANIGTAVALFPILKRQNEPLALGYGAAAWVLGRSILREPTAWVVAFLAGWAILRVAALVPILGGLVWFAAVVVGLGALAVAIWRARTPSRTTPAAA